MANIVYPTPADMMALVSRVGNADLLFTLTESSVDLPQQWRLISLGYSSIRRFPLQFRSDLLHLSSQ